MDRLKRFDKTLPDKEPFRSELNLQDITNEDYAHAQKVWEKFEIKNIGEYHNKLFLADVFDNFRNKCIKFYEHDPTHFLSAPGLAWEAFLKKNEVELELLTDIDMFLMVEKWIKGMCQAIHRRYAKANNKYMKSYDNNIISSRLMYLDANNLYGLAMSQKLKEDFKTI